MERWLSLVLLLLPTPTDYPITRFLSIENLANEYEKRELRKLLLKLLMMPALRTQPIFKHGY